MSQSEDDGDFDEDNGYITNVQNDTTWKPPELPGLQHPEALLDCS